MGNFNKNIEGIRNRMKDIKADMYAIHNPELIELDEYVKGLYLKILCTVIQYENDPSEMQILFLKRIVQGIGVEDAAEEFMRKALEITEDNIQEFLSILGENQIKYYFAFDGLLLVSMGGGNKNNYEYLAELIELLKINKEDLKYISMVAQSVLKQESSLYDTAKDLVTERVDELDFTSYIQNYYVGAIVDTDTKKHYLAAKKEISTSINYPTSFNERYVVFENLIISLETNWKFTGCESVLFKNCDFTSKGGNLVFTSIGKVSFENCKASGFKNRVASMREINNFEVFDSEFIDCGYTCDNELESGGVFAIDNEWNTPLECIRLNGNKLLNCYIRGGMSGVFLGIENIRESRRYFFDFKTNNVINQLLEVKNNVFDGCKCINNGNPRAAIIYTYSLNKWQLEQENNSCTGELTKVFENGIL